MPRIREMNDRAIQAVLMQAMGDYIKSYDAARLTSTLTVYREAKIDAEKVMGKCVQRIAVIKQAVQGERLHKPNVREALKQCYEDCLAAYEDARISAENCPIIAERVELEKRKGHIIERRMQIKAALDELT